MNDERAPPTGFLAHLVERVRLTEPLLQRRQPSLFEPPQAWTDAWTRGAAVDGTDSSAHAAADAQGVPATAQPATAPITMFAPAPTAMPAPAPGHGANGVDKPPKAAIAEAATTIHQELRVLREGLQIDPSLRTIRERAAQAPAAPSPIAMATVLVKPPGLSATDALRASATRATDKPGKAQAAPEPSGRTTTRPPEAATAITPRQPVRRTESIPTSPAPRTREMPTLPTRAIQRAAVMQATSRQSHSPEIRELPPVQVTIGRIDVRAVTAPTTADRSQRSSPRLSLEQYLHERHGDRP